MKCPEALETMLDAEPSDLSPHGSTALAAHLQSCANCARVAAAMHADIRALAAVMPAVPVGTRTPWRLRQGIVLASAAAVLLFVMIRERPVPTVRPHPADATAVVVARPTAPLPAPTPTQSARATTRVSRVAPLLYAMPDPEPLDIPVGLALRDSTGPASEPAFDGVSVSAHGKVTVLKTSNPSITVIWFN